RLGVIGHHIELVVHAVNEKYVSSAADAIHRFRALSSSPAEGMCGAILRPAISFHLDDRSRNSLSIPHGNHQKFSEQVSRNSENVWPGVKLTWKFHVLVSSSRFQVSSSKFQVSNSA